MKPILKWAGGKSSLIKDIKEYLPKDYQTRAYHEAFLGGGALFFNLMPKKGSINDINERLMNFYEIVKLKPYELINETSKYQKYVTDKKMYYDLRDEFNKDNLNKIKSASLLLYLNKTAYNGLFRVNSSNNFNVPIGKYSNPTLVNEQRILNASKALQNIEIYSTEFNYINKIAKEGDICYFDPPYYQSEANKFTDYSKNGFTLDDHKRLCKLCSNLNEREIFCIISNSNSEIIVNMYKNEGFDIVRVDNKWMISCNTSSRKKMTEVIIHNISSI